MIASGADGDCGSRPIDRAIVRVGMRASSAPSSSTAPLLGFSSRPSARRVVDLPQAFGPTTTVTRPSGTASSRACTTGRSSYASVSSCAASLLTGAFTIPLMPFSVLMFRLLRYGCG